MGRRASGLMCSAAAIAAIALAAAPAGAQTVMAQLRPTGTVTQAGYNLQTGPVDGGAFGPLAVGELNVTAGPDGQVFGTLAVYGERGWLISAFAGARGPDGLLRGNLGLARGAGPFRSGIRGGTLRQRADGTLAIRVRPLHG